MRTQYFPSLILGLLLVYIGTFGLSGLGVSFQLQGTLFTENFSNLNAWTTAGMGSAMILGGHLYVSCPAISTATESVSHSLSGVTIPNKFTIEFVMTINQLGGVVSIGLHNTAYTAEINIYSNHMDTGSGFSYVSPDYQQHTWTLVCDYTVGSVNVYLDGATSPLLTGPIISASNSQPSLVISVSSQGNVATIVTVNSIGIGTSTSGGAPSAANTGSVKVTCTKISSGVASYLAGVSITIGTLPSQLTGSDGTVTISDVPADTETVSASKTGEITVVSQTVPVTTANTVDNPAIVNFDFTPAPVSTQQGTIKVTCTKDKNPLAGVSCTATRTGNIALASVTSDNSGVAIITVTGTDLTYSWVISGSKAGETTQTDPNAVAVTNGQQALASLDFSATPSNTPTGTITIIVRDSGNNLVAANVKVYASSSSSTPVETGTSSTSSSPLKFVSMAYDSYTVAVTGLTSQTKTMSSSNSDLEFDFATTSQAQTGNQSSLPTIDFSHIWNNIESMIDSNRQSLVTIGALIALVSFVGLMLPPRRIPISI